MQAVILIGIQGTGKSSFCKERFFATHVRLNLDMLKTRHRENLLFRACLDAMQPLVIDNTNVTALGALATLRMQEPPDSRLSDITSGPRQATRSNAMSSVAVAPVSRPEVFWER